MSQIPLAVQTPDAFLVGGENSRLDELDLRLFRKDGVSGRRPGVGLVAEPVLENGDAEEGVKVFVSVIGALLLPKPPRLTRRKVAADGANLLVFERKAGRLEP